MAKFCAKCGKELVKGANVCDECGTVVDETVVASSNKDSNSFAVAGFVLSLVSLICCGGTSVLGLIFSIIGLVNANKNNGEGKGMSIAGIIISAISFVLLIVLYILFFIIGLAEEMY